MQFLYKNELVKIDLSATGRLLILSPDGEKPRESFERVKLEAISAGGLHFSGFEKKAGSNYEYVELYFAYNI